MPDPPATASIIFFDIGSVLVEVNERGGLAEIVRLTGLAPEWLGTRMGSEALYTLERGKITLRDYYSAVFEDAPTEKPLSYAAFERFWLGLLKSEMPAAGLLPALRKQARVWLLTNSNHIHIDYLRKNYPFMSQVDGVICSYEVGYRKPEREIFRYALRVTGTPAGQALFVDDKRDNVAAARELGIRAHQYIDLAGLVTFLAANGLEVRPIQDPGI
ncbi:MAG: HAD family hydrolase [Candidatus Neomarinimicrobiota bacterium]